MGCLTSEFKVIDIDTHVIEPYDLWTSRVSVQKYGDQVPHVRRHRGVGGDVYKEGFWDGPATDMDFWYFGDKRSIPAAGCAMAGWGECPPDYPPRLELVDPSTWRAEDRLKRMDEYGIHAQVLFPNVVFFGADNLVRLGNADLMLDCVRAYNNWQVEWSSAAPHRFLPQAILPFWDLDLAIVEMQRCAQIGHRGIVLTSEPESFGQPKLTNPHWDKLWRAAEEMGFPVNFHIGSGGMENVQARLLDPKIGPHATTTHTTVQTFLGNSSVVSQLICGGICHRFPALNFVSVESGLGWVPFLLASLDWQWTNCGVARENPHYDLLPSEYFKRQIYGSFWFEPREMVLNAIESLGADWILYETDFPHPTSMSPGPATSAVKPTDYIEEIFRGVPKTTVEKILRGNAARIYHIS